MKAIAFPNARKYWDFCPVFKKTVAVIAPTLYMLSLSNNYPNLKCHCPICQSHSIALLPGWQGCLTQLHLRQRQLLQGVRAWPVCDLIPIYIYYQTHHLSCCVFGQGWNDSDLRLKLGRIPNFSIWYTFDSYSTRFNSVLNFDIDFINFRFVFGRKLATGKKISQFHDTRQFWHSHFTVNG